MDGEELFGLRPEIEAADALRAQAAQTHELAERSKPSPRTPRLILRHEDEGGG